MNLKVNQLMCCDWISFSGRPTRITALDGLLSNIETEALDINPTAKRIKDDHPDIAPIPLTEEHLVLNGWRKRELFRAVEYTLKVHLQPLPKYLQRIMFLQSPSGNRIYIKIRGIKCSFEGYIEYVHQLQDALRTCKLYDMANNFKI